MKPLIRESLESRRQHSSALEMALLVVLATALRVFRLGTKSLWLDEAMSITLVQLGWHDFLRALVHRQANMALYYFLLRMWIRLGTTEWLVRSLSVIAGVATIPAIYLLGKILFGPRVGKIAAALCCFHVFLIRYSQEARGYSLVVLLAALSSYFFVLSIRNPSLKNWGAYVATSVLMVYAQVFGGWVLISQWASLLLLRRHVPWRRFLCSAALISLLISPLAYCLFFLSDRSQLAWLKKPSVGDLYNFSFDLTGDGGFLLLLMNLALLVVALSGVLREWRSSDTGNLWSYAFLATWLGLPVVMLVMISWRWPVFLPRFLIFCVPPLLLLVAQGLSRLGSKIIFAAAGIVLLGLSLNGDFSYYRNRSDAEHTDDWRNATRYILSRAEVGDAVLFTYSEERLVFDQYQRQLNLTDQGAVEYPQGSDVDLLTRAPSRPDDQLLDEMVRSHSRVWVISAYQPGPVSRHVAQELGSHFNDHAVRDFGFVRTDLFSQPIPAAQIP